MKKFAPKTVIKKLRNDQSARLIAIEQSISSLADTIGKLQDQLHAQQLNNPFVRSYRLSDDEIIVKIFSGAKMHLDPKDTAITPHMVLDGIWESDVTYAWLSVAKKGDTVLDIGANFGYFGILAAQQTQKNCRVVHFEANPNLITYINNSVRENALEMSTKVENIAISSSKKEVTLRVMKDNLASSSLHSKERMQKNNKGFKEITIAETIKVQSTTIDDYCKENGIGSIDLIKMDIEGYEEEAYQGMREMVGKSPSLSLFIEFTHEAYKNPKKFYEQMLSDFGNVYSISGSGKITMPADTSYEAIIDISSGWTMPIFSKNPNLAG